ncbi:phosphonate ABC transporter, permease protein PhnE [Bdellovibrio svalbardensis]|uniref:Phosphonate ABC transporter, permease protein PhnE n=1 Tax=Bdellovibrio svalbardensis TaxID=2972972 RepID=A0ABT6DFL8_9BACT|nr:phosphonate ABC transporter, permease protein PhnE [Bdellovibrio svalbardensis]MDG0815622.1 phosphonate ABC transporter, permease protein PhnE [Bdellovibrio svalbardensis]
MFRRTVFDSILGAFLLSVLAIALFVGSEEQLLNLTRDVLFVGGFFILSAGISWSLRARGVVTLGDVLFKTVKSEEARAWYKSFWGWQLVVSLIVAFMVAVIKTQFSFVELFDYHGFGGAVRLFKGLFNPNWDVLPRAVLNIIETIFMAFLATALAIPVAFVLSFFCAKNIMKGPAGYFVYLILRTVLNVTRSIEALIWAIIFSVWVGIGPFAGMLALMIHSVASLAKQYSEMVESAEEGPIEAIESTGANKLQTIWYAIVPQVLLPYISFTVYRWDINVRMATVIGLVGGGGIGTMLIQYQGQAMWREVGCIIAVIAVVVWALDQASAYIREALK